MKTELHALPSDRKFGWTFTGLFLFLGTWGLLRGGPHDHAWLFALAALTAAVTTARADWLAPLNRAWMKLGALLNRVVSPVVLGILFFAVFTPMGQVMRLFGWDAMKRRFEPAAPTYWTRRDPPGPADDSFKDLF
jgi:hypothetical protein